MEQQFSRVIELPSVSTNSRSPSQPGPVLPSEGRLVTVAARAGFDTLIGFQSVSGWVFCSFF